MRRGEGDAEATESGVESLESVDEDDCGVEADWAGDSNVVADFGVDGSVLSVLLCCCC